MITEPGLSFVQQPLFRFSGSFDKPRVAVLEVQDDIVHERDGLSTDFCFRRLFEKDPMEPSMTSPRRAFMWRVSTPSTNFRADVALDFLDYRVIAVEGAGGGRE